MSSACRDLLLDVQSLSADGRAVCRDGKRIVFVQGGLPGQRIQARLLREKQRFAEAVCEAVIRPAPDEIPAFCPHADACGGCPLQRLPYDVQLHWKTHILQDALTRIGQCRDIPLLPILPSPRLRGYRNKMEFAFAPDPEQGLRLGLRQRNSHAVTEITDCRLLPAGSMEMLEQLRRLTRQSGLPAWHQGRGFWRFAVLRMPTPRKGRPPQALMICITAPGTPRQRAHVAALGKALLARCPTLTGFVHDERRDAGDYALGEQHILHLGTTTLTEQLHDLEFQVPYDAFFQINSSAAEQLATAVLSMAHPAGKETFIDLYCGVGAPGLCLASNVKTLYGVERTASAAAQAKQNADRAGFHHCHYMAGDAKRLLPRLPRADLVLVDPPRAGLHATTSTTLLRMRPRHILYISCNPATLARDIKLFSAAYHLKKVQPVDLFPHTPHVETVVQLYHQESTV